MLEVKALTKRYASIPALNAATFTARPGEVVGYLGPNGSGKSTTVKMLTGLLEPSAGAVFFEGRNIQDDLIGYRRRLGYVPEEPAVYPFLSGQEYLQLVGRLRSIPEKPLAGKIDGLLKLLALHESRYSAISSYSKGMRQKVLIAAALLHNPDLLILDEPFSGLDVTMALILKNLLKSLAREGKVILYSSHVLETVERICSRVLILHQGSIVADDSVERLRDLMSSPSLEDVFAQLVLQEDTERIAEDIVEVMKS